MRRGYIYSMLHALSLSRVVCNSFDETCVVDLVQEEVDFLMHIIEEMMTDDLDDIMR